MGAVGKAVRPEELLLKAEGIAPENLMDPDKRTLLSEFAEKAAPLSSGAESGTEKEHLVSKATAARGSKNVFIKLQRTFIPFQY